VFLYVVLAVSPGLSGGFVFRGSSLSALRSIHTLIRLLSGYADKALERYHLSGFGGLGIQTIAYYNR